MRLLLISILLLLAASLPVLAQDDACSQSDPCLWVLDVDEDGIIGEGLTATAGDWYAIEVLNFDDQEHVLTLESYEIQLTLAAGGSALSDPFLLDTSGAFALEDDVTGDFVWLQVSETDVVDDAASDDQAAQGDDADTPLPLLLVPVALLVALALIGRRR